MTERSSGTRHATGDVTLEIAGVSSATSSGLVSLTVKTNLSRHLLGTARLFQQQAARIAAEESALPWPQPSWDDSRSYAIGTIVMAVSALEASINELYLEAVDGNRRSLAALASPQISQLTALWESVDELAILPKYQLVLAVCGRQQFDKGREPYQAVAALIDLRNAVVHFKPEWEDRPERHGKLEQRLRGRFPDCVLASQAKGMMAWFPGKCLGLGCATWAVQAVTTFMTEFCSRLELPDRFG